MKIDISKEGVPCYANEVIIYAYVRSGYAKERNKYGHITFASNYTHGTMEKFLFYFTYDQPAISFNSENISLPVAKERYIYAKMDPPPSENFISRVKVIGYKLQQ